MGLHNNQYDFSVETLLLNIVSQNVGGVRKRLETSATSSRVSSSTCSESETGEAWAHRGGARLADAVRYTAGRPPSGANGVAPRRDDLIDDLIVL